MVEHGKNGPALKEGAFRLNEFSHGEWSCHMDQGAAVVNYNGPRMRDRPVFKIKMRPRQCCRVH